MQHHDQLIELAARQHSAVAVRQIMALGASRSEVANIVTSGEFDRVTTSVLRLAGSPRSRGQRVMEAVLDAGETAALSHRADAAWWRLAGFNLADLEITRLRNASSQPTRLARIIHEPRCFPEHHRTILDGVPVVVASRIPFDLAATQPWLAEKALDRAWAMNLLNHWSVTALLQELAERGRPGIRQMRELLAECGPEYRPNDSNLEDRFQQLAREAGLHDLERQRQLLGREWLGRGDFLSRRLQTVIEVNSALYHAALIDQRADEERRDGIEALGLALETFTDSEVWFDPLGTVGRLRAIRTGRPRSAA